LRQRAFNDRVVGSIPIKSLKSEGLTKTARNPLWLLSFICITLSIEVETAMAANALVQTRIDAEVRDRASAVLESMGLTVSDAVRILLTRTANEGALPLELVSGSEAHDAWFRTKVLEALNDTRPDISDDEVESHFVERRAAARLKGNAGKS
jgi:DNA-damage-inducible protein J